MDYLNDLISHSEASILGDLPPALRAEVLGIGSVVRSLPFWKDVEV